MAEVRVNLYEGLFLLNQQHASADWVGSVEFVREVLKRAEAEVLALRRWEERKLAYEIQGQKRGTYLLAYFRARGTQIANIERDCNLSEQILRVMITKADHVGDVELEAAKKDAELTLEARFRGGGDRDRDRDRGGDRDRGAERGGDRDRAPQGAAAGGRRAEASVTEAPEEGARTPKADTDHDDEVPETAKTVEGSRSAESTAG